MVVPEASLRLADLHPPLRDVVAGELRRLILSGELAPGSRLVEDRLAEQLGVSRNPIREAIRVLAPEGFIEVMPRRGACVARLSVLDAENLFDVRMALEPVGARLAARRASPEGCERLRQILGQAHQGRTPAPDRLGRRDRATTRHASAGSCAWRGAGQACLAGTA